MSKLDLDAPGEARRQLAQLASGLGQGIDAATVKRAIRDTLRVALRPVTRCSTCRGVGLDPTSPLACRHCGGYGSPVTPSLHVRKAR